MCTRKSWNLGLLLGSLLCFLSPFDAFPCHASTQGTQGDQRGKGVSQNGDDDPRLQEYEKPGVRFDMLVRADFFAGMFGDNARLDRGMRFCERVLAKHRDTPKLSYGMAGACYPGRRWLMRKETLL